MPHAVPRLRKDDILVTDQPRELRNYLDNGFSNSVGEISTHADVMSTHSIIPSELGKTIREWWKRITDETDRAIRKGRHRGNSTISANLAASFAEIGLNTWYIGCDPKADGSMTLLNGNKIPTFLERMKEGDADKDYFIAEGYKGVKCVEIGGPLAGVGCAGVG